MGHVELQATGTGWINAVAVPETSVDTTAVLEEDVPTEGTVGSLFVNIGWVSNPSGTAVNDINMTVSFGNAWLQIFVGQWGWDQYIIAQGQDGYGNWFFKTSSAPVAQYCWC